MKITALTVAKALEALDSESYKTAIAFGKELRARSYKSGKGNGDAKPPRKNAWMTRRKNAEAAAKAKAAAKVEKQAAKIKKSVAVAAPPAEA